MSIYGSLFDAGTSALILALGGNMAIGLTTLGLRSRRPSAPRALLLPDRLSRESAFISVHLACYDEPPAMVLETLDALAAMHGPAFEVIVIDNNTRDPARWQPVEKHCATLGPQFRFYHCVGVKGAKAGALNLALERANPRTTHVAVVDADYQVEPNFLAQAIDTICARQVDFVQFPQAYRHHSDCTAVALELGDYFQSIASVADSTDSMLLTGTLSVISLEWLHHAGGWPVDSITEDAALGLALWRMGARGSFIDRVAGRGLLPVDLAGLRLQRDRWTAGNVQTLIGGMRQGLWSDRRRGRQSVIAQLTAWPAFHALPMAVLVFSLAAILGNLPGEWAATANFAAATSLLLLIAAWVEAVIIKRTPQILPVRLALLWTSSLAWLPALWGRRLAFQRTPKDRDGRCADEPRRPAPEWAAVVALAMVPLWLAMGAVLPAVTAFCLALPLAFAAAVDGMLQRNAA